jgi:hypothetical protein
MSTSIVMREDLRDMIDEPVQDFSIYLISLGEDGETVVKADGYDANGDLCTWSFKRERRGYWRIEGQRD